MWILRCLISAAILASCLVPIQAAHAQRFRRGAITRSYGNYREMGCDCSSCVRARGGTFAEVYGSRRKSPTAVVRDPHTPSPQAVISRALAIADVGPQDILYDIGCGDGRVLETAVRDYGCGAVGIEIDATTASQARARLQRVLPRGSPWRVTTGDACKYNLSRATVVYLNLYPDIIKRIVPKLASCTRIISYKHKIPGGFDNQRIDTPNGPIYFVDRRCDDDQWSGWGTSLSSDVTPSTKATSDSWDAWGTELGKATPVKPAVIKRVIRQVVKCKT